MPIIIKFYGLNILMHIRFSSQCLAPNKHLSDTHFLSFFVSVKIIIIIIIIILIDVIIINARS